MKTFAARRTQNLTLLIIMCVVFYFAYSVWQASLKPTNFYTGWILAGCMIFLTLYNLRKKLTFLPALGTSALWLQLHLYIGFFTIFMFVLHVNFHVPNGIFESVLFILFFAVVGSGVFGIFITRRSPRLMTRKGETVLYERIPIFRKKIKDEVEKLVFDSIEETNSTTLSDFYLKKLHRYFSRPQNILRHLFESHTPLRRLKNEVDVVERYLDSNEKEVLQEIVSYIETKDNLDYQYAHQLMLKGWLFFHIPVTYALLVFSFVHGILAYAFHGGGM